MGAAVGGQAPGDETFRVSHGGQLHQAVGNAARFLAVFGLAGDRPPVEGRLHVEPAKHGLIADRNVPGEGIRFVGEAFFGRGEDDRAIQVGVVVDRVPAGIDESPPQLGIRCLNRFVDRRRSSLHRAARDRRALIGSASSAGPGGHNGHPANAQGSLG
ncbi:MAG TPA: hypothetical protein PLF81_30365 [Candidatus Anammoximicrobium sp.]|nr:hypothetical protein [Candidatus Anammoximicrobium sp.]